MTEKFDWAKWFTSKGPMDWKPGEERPEPVPEVQPKWKIPAKVAIQATNSGGGCGFTKKQNPNHPTDLDEIRASAEGCIQAGASVVHFDHDASAWHTKDGKQMTVDESYFYVVKPLLEKYGREKLLPHLNGLRGPIHQELRPMITGLAELSYIPLHMSPTWIRETAVLYKEFGVRGELIINSTASVALADRLVIKNGLWPNPNLWIILAGACNQTHRMKHDEYWNEREMCNGLIYLVNRIRESDPEGFITVCCAGRASRYLVTLSLMLGLNVRMGMEDTVYKYPHKDDLITNNGEEVRWAIDMARMLGREVMTPNEFRKAVGLKGPRFDHAETLRDIA